MPCCVSADFLSVWTPASWVVLVIHTCCLETISGLGIWHFHQTLRWIWFQSKGRRGFWKKKTGLSASWCLFRGTCSPRFQGPLASFQNHLCKHNVFLCYRSIWWKKVVTQKKEWVYSKLSQRAKRKQWRINVSGRFSFTRDLHLHTLFKGLNSKVSSNSMTLWFKT